MTDAPPPTRRENLLWGLALILLSLFLGYMIYSRPEKLNVPAWVAYSAAAAFLLAGAQLVATAIGSRMAKGWLSVACVVAMWLPALWIAFGPGARTCVATFSFLETGAICRTVFGFSALLVAGIITLFVRHLLKRSP
jgi:hypothetical protein